jgi:hypothetical protein
MIDEGIGEEEGVNKAEKSVDREKLPVLVLDRGKEVPFALFKLFRVRLFKSFLLLKLLFLSPSLALTV